MIIRDLVRFCGASPAQKRRSVEHKQTRHPDLCKTVTAHIKRGRAPEQIGNRMLFEDTEPPICKETTWRYIRSKEGMAQELWWYLPGTINPADRAVQKSAKRRRLTAMSAPCSIPSTWRIAVRSTTGKAV